jgi:hypothetical protein
MPVTIQFADQGLGVVLRADNLFSSGEVGRELAAFIAEHRAEIANIRYCHSDYSGAYPKDSSSDEIGRIAEQCVRLSAINPHLVATVCAPEKLIFGLARMWEMLSSQTGWDIHIFPSEEEARLWTSEKLDRPVTFR